MLVESADFCHVILLVLTHHVSLPSILGQWHCILHSFLVSSQVGWIISLIFCLWIRKSPPRFLLKIFTWICLYKKGRSPKKTTKNNKVPFFTWICWIRLKIKKKQICLITWTQTLKTWYLQVPNPAMFGPIKRVRVCMGLSCVDWIIAGTNLFCKHANLILRITWTYLYRFH